MAALLYGYIVAPIVHCIKGCIFQHTNSMVSDHLTFKNNVQESIEKDTFIKLTLSKARKKGALKNVYVRLIELKQVPHFSFTYRYTTKDEVKNYPLQAGVDHILSLLQTTFLNAHLQSTTYNWSLETSKKGKIRLAKQPSRVEKVPTRQHDKTKKRLVPADRPFLQLLGIASQEGKILKSGQSKYKQINKYIEILDRLIPNDTFEQPIRIVDMGSGKGYLTFALYDYLKNERQLEMRLTGIELRPQLVAFCNQVAEQLDFQELSFLAKDINDFPAEEIDILIALHACDTATDVAIAKGIQAEAQLIVCAPCCHKQIRQQINCHSPLQSILKHGILEERQAEMLTDGIRALLLESKGYETKVFEFISNEHTSKNVMITAQMNNQPNAAAAEQVEALKTQFGIDYHYLEKLLVEV